MERWKYLLFAGLISLAGGCVSLDSPHAALMLEPAGDPIAAADVNIERGKPVVVLDTVGWVLGIPGKILLWDRRINNHRITPETEAEIRDYVAQNGLADVKVRLNQYDPIDEWERLRNNKRISPVARYTLGTLHWVGYTILPDRVFGGDYYNPYTNTISVSSDVPVLVVREAAYSKDVHLRKHPSWYAVSQEIAIASVWHSSISTREAARFYHSYGTPDQQFEAHRILGPRYGMDIGAAFDSVLPIGSVGTLTGVVIGHIAGRREGDQARREALQAVPPAPVAPETPPPGPSDSPGPVLPASHTTKTQFAVVE